MTGPLRALARWEDRLAGGRLVDAVLRDRLLVLLAIAVVAFAASAVHLTRYPQLREAAATATPGATPAPGGPVAATTVTVGPAVGADLEAYVASRTDELATLSGADGVVAMVSFDGYLAPSEVLRLLDDRIDVHRAAFRLPVVGEPPRQVDVDDGDLTTAVTTSVSDLLGPLVAEVDDVERLLASGSVGDDDFVADLEERLATLRDAADLDAGDPTVVYAVVVGGPPDALRALAGRTGVRLVDPAPPGTDIGASAFYGVRPEDGDVATHGHPG